MVHIFIIGAYIHYIKELEPARNEWNFIPEWVEPMSGLSGENAPDYSSGKLTKWLTQLFCYSQTLTKVMVLLK